MVEESRTELKEIIEKKREEEEEKAYREIGKLAEKEPRERLPNLLISKRLFSVSMLQEAGLRQV